MIKKTIFTYLVILLSILFLGLDLNTVTDWILLEKVRTSPQDAYLADGTELITVGGRGICLGDSLDTVLGHFGDAVDVLPGEYGFSWYIFHENYKNYVQIGFFEDRVVAVYTNAPSFSLRGITIGASRDDSRITFGDLIYYIKKQEGIYQVLPEDMPSEGNDIFLYQDCYLHIFYDVFKENTVTSVLLIARNLEASSPYYGTPSEPLARSYERQNFYVTNALRVREGKDALFWSDALHQTALTHSKDMAEHDYFSHEDRVGRLAGERLRMAGISYRLAGENLAMGSRNSLYMHELLMNSEGHRKNILQDYRFLGVGVSFRADGSPFLTQHYSTP